MVFAVMCASWYGGGVRGLRTFEGGEDGTVAPLEASSGSGFVVSVGDSFELGATMIAGSFEAFKLSLSDSEDTSLFDGPDGASCTGSSLGSPSDGLSFCVSD